MSEYWICAGLLIAATVTPSKHSAAVAFIGSAYLTVRLGFTLTRCVARKLGLIHASAHSVAFPPTGFDRVNHILKVPIAITLLISSLASLVISAVILWRLRATENVVSSIRSDGI
jgi:hypothetical protein